MRIVGIDCGSERTGYGVVDSDGRRHQLVVTGVIRTSPRHTFPTRLKQIHDHLVGLFQQHQPDAVAVENVFHASNVQTVLKLAQVRGVALLAAAEIGVPVGEYSPLEIKRSLVGYGRATKSQVQLMVTSLLDLTEPPKSLDASDALATAICHGLRNLSSTRVASRRDMNA